MSGAILAGVWTLGPRITAAVLGTPFAQYRPASASAPLAVQLGTIPVWVTGDKSLRAQTPIPRDKPQIFAALDPSLTAPGDYLVGTLFLQGQDGSVLTDDAGNALDLDQPGATLFVASQDVPMPIVVVLCNAVVSILRPGDETPGPGFYSGAAAGQAVLASGWPASLIYTTSRGDGALRLPGDATQGQATVLLPVSLPVAPRFADVVERADGNGVTDRFVVKSAELTARGWSLLVTDETA